MKFLLLIYYSLYTSTLLLAQDSVVKNIGDFSILKAYDLINVELIKSDKNIAEISGDNKNNIEIVNKNGVLKIRLNIEKSFDGKKTNVKLFYNSIESIDANEGAIITSNDTIKQYENELKTQEASLNYNISLENIVYQTIEKYFDAYIKSENIKDNLEAQKGQKEIYNIAKKRFKIGSVKGR